MTDNLFEVKRKYSHRIVGIYKMTEPDSRAKQAGHWASMDGEQYYESSSTGGAVPFKFLRELLMYVNGKRLYGSYYESLALIARQLNEHFESYVKRNHLIIDTQAMALEKMKGSVEIRIMVSLLRDDETKVDADVMFFIDGASKGITDIDEVFRAKGLVVSSCLIKELLYPLSQATTNPQDEASWLANKAKEQGKN